ncbi:MAG: transposase [Spirochaetaceae bacterium]|nr:MAG: transposase [Spirochaetaceae bacterium]
MAIIPQPEIFCWHEFEEIGDLERLELILRHLPDEQLMQTLERERGNGRNDYSVRAVWNSILAGIVFGHPSTASLRRELLRNAQLRQICGFGVGSGTDAVPQAWVYSRFFGRLEKHSAEIRRIFDALVDRCRERLPGFGRQMGCDGKALASFAGRSGKSEHNDRRGEHDAAWAVHTHHSRGSDGVMRETTKRWFGFKLHLIADTSYELPIAFSVLPANHNEMPVMHRLLDGLAEGKQEILHSCEVWSADRGYDDGKLLQRLWDEYRIKPVIGIRNTWKDPDTTRVVSGLENVTYDWNGTVRCVCPAMMKEREMAFGGFEKERETLKYRCPARHYGYECGGSHRCPVRSAIRIPLQENRRIFTPVARSSYQWKRLYNKRTALERINSRIDTSFGFERHTIRGLRKMSMMVTISLSLMLAVAVGRTVEKQPQLIRSLARSA